MRASYSFDEPVFAEKMLNYLTEKFYPRCLKPVFCFPKIVRLKKIAKRFIKYFRHFKQFLSCSNIQKNLLLYLNLPTKLKPQTKIGKNVGLKDQDKQKTDHYLKKG